ncbi:MAG: Gfo/Idh/MocA family oxidoreductase [Solirubrobacteraceae bacterium]|nr:Gfo/Idh/MocA family oxidoreductase [Patulibacter sp.]
MTDLAIGIIGLGQMGANHFNVWTRVDGANVIAVADPDPARHEKVLLGFPDVARHTDWHDLIARGDLDAVCVVSPSPTHAEVAIAALEAGLHVLIEKPIATTVEDAIRVADAGEKAGKLVMVGHVERFNQAAIKLKALIADGRLGKLFRVHATRVGPLPQRITDTGVTLDLATHDVDLMSWITDRPITEVTAHYAQYLHSSQEDLVQAMLSFGDDGPLGLLDVNWLTPEKRRELVVIGEGGVLRASLLTQDVFYVGSQGIRVEWDALATLRGPAEGEMIRFAIPKSEPLRGELEAFRDAILAGGPSPVPAMEGARALATVLAIRESALHRAPRRPITESIASVEAAADHR